MVAPGSSNPCQFFPPDQDAAIQKIVDINIVSAVLLAKAAAPHMGRGGAILFVSSYTAFNPTPPIAMWVPPPGPAGGIFARSVRGSHAWRHLEGSSRCSRARSALERDATTRCIVQPCFAPNALPNAVLPCPLARRYAVSKTALLGLTKALAEELGPDGIRVNCIAPGIVPTKARRCLRQACVRHTCRHPAICFAASCCRCT